MAVGSEPEICNHCNSSNITFKEQLTFSYWYCRECKNEVDISSTSTTKFTTKYEAIEKPYVLADKVDFFHFARWMASVYGMEIIKEEAYASNGKTVFNIDFNNTSPTKSSIGAVDFANYEFPSKMDRLVHPQLSVEHSSAIFSLRTIKIEFAVRF